MEDKVLDNTERFLALLEKHDKEVKALLASYQRALASTAIGDVTPVIPEDSLGGLAARLLGLMQMSSMPGGIEANLSMSPLFVEGLRFGVYLGETGMASILFHQKKQGAQS